MPTITIRSAGYLGLAIFLAGCTQDTSPATFEPQVAPLPSVGVAGSLGPRLAEGPDGSIVMSWIEPRGDGHSLQYAVLDDDHWGEPHTVASGDNWFVNWADFPSVVPLSDQLWAAHWLARQPAGGYAYDVNMALSHDNGKTWSAPTLAHSDHTDTEHGFVSLYPLENGVGFVYLDGRKQANEFTDDPNETGMTLRAATLSTEGVLTDEALLDSLVCDCCQTDVAMTAEGPVAVYRNRTENEIRDIFVTRRVDGRWTDGTPVSDDGWEIYGCPVNGPEIFAEGTDVVVAWFTAANDAPRIRFARSADSGRRFSAPLDLASGELLGHVGMTLDANGGAWVMWQGSAGDGEAELNIRRVLASGEPGPTYTIVQKGGVAAFSVPQMLAHGRYLVLAWTAGEYGNTQIVSARIALPVDR